MKKRVAVLLLVLAVASLAPGCWNYREVDDLLIVAGAAIDRGYEGHRFHMTIDLADTSNAGKDKPVVSTLLETEGDTLSDCEANCVRKVGTELYWPNCQVLIISNDVAQEGIQPVVDWANRVLEIRETVEIFISQEKTAKEVLQQQSATMSITSFEIDRYYELNERIQPVAQYILLLDVYNMLDSKGRELALPALSLQMNMTDKDAVLNGMALFRGDRLLGYLTADDSKYAMYAMDRVKGGTLDVKADTGNTIAAFTVYGNRTQVDVKSISGRLDITIQTATDAALNEYDTKTDLTQKDKIGELEFMAENQLAERIARTVQMVQSQYGVDIFGFGDRLHKKDPAAWSALSGDWNKAFADAHIAVSSKINIRGKEQSRIPAGGGG